MSNSESNNMDAAFVDNMIKKLKAIHDKEEAYFKDPLNCVNYILNCLNCDDAKQRSDALHSGDCLLARICTNIVESGKIELVDQVCDNKYGYDDTNSDVASTLLINAMFNNREVMWHIAKKWKKITRKNFEMLKDCYVDYIFDNADDYRKGLFMPEYDMLMSFWMEGDASNRIAK